MAVSDLLTDPVAPASLLASRSQREAIEAQIGPALVLAGPGAGKTFCLIERIRHLVEHLGVDPARICAFTFTNKAADEIASRLTRHLGARADGIKRRTLHAFCAEILREFALHVSLAPGFGIADEEYQLAVLRRLGVQTAWRESMLRGFSTHRLRGDPLRPNDERFFFPYQEYLARRNVVDFDTLVLKAAELLEQPAVAAQLRARWHVVLVDEFQDLSPVQYRIVHALALDHRHVFAVGDDEQSIYAWAGADPAVFTSFVNDFGIARGIYLDENRRCPRNVFDLARRLIAHNPPIFGDREPPRADRSSPFAVQALDFPTEREELAWLVEDLERDRANHAHQWGDVALLYRKHTIGHRIEAAFLNANVPCRLARGRALSEEPVIRYLLAALRVIQSPRDQIHRDAFVSLMLPRAVVDEARSRRRRGQHSSLMHQLQHVQAMLPRADETARKIRHAISRYRNLAALARTHSSVDALARELLSHRVGLPVSPLEDRSDEVSDPAEHPEVVRLEEKLRYARATGRALALPRLGGVEIALRGMLLTVGFDRVHLGDLPSDDAERVSADDAPSLGIALGLFKALQMLEIGERTAAFSDFTAIDLETTDRRVDSAEIVEVAAVRVRGGHVVDTYVALVRPPVPIPPAATALHGITDDAVSTAEPFAAVWPKLRQFIGDDVVIAHNGYHFDFPILARTLRSVGESLEHGTYDSLLLARDLLHTSRKLEDIARRFGIDPGRSHRALDDASTLAAVMIHLSTMKLARTRKTALTNLLDHLGVALALSDPARLCDEARVFRDFCRLFAFSRYSSCLEFYERERGNDETLPAPDELIDALGGAELMLKIRTQKTPEERYPVVMARLRELLMTLTRVSLADQIAELLERVALSATDGVVPEPDRVNLLTLHSTKGLEFSRVYVIGAEDGQLPGFAPNGTNPEKDVEEARRLLYVGMTRAKDRLVLTRCATRDGKPTGGHRFLDEMELRPAPPA